MSPETRSHRWNTLLVEDNEDDAFIVQRAFRTAGVSTEVNLCRDGKSALNYLEGEADYSDRETFPLPHLIILDLKLPLLNGLQVLKWLRQHADFQSQIVVVLTSSAELRDIQEAHRLHANAYLVKPSSLDGMVEIARCIRTCWLNEKLETVHRVPNSHLVSQSGVLTR